MDVGPDQFCPGCTAFTNNVSDLDDLAESGVAWATVSFADNCGAGAGFALSVFLSDGDDIYRTYSTTARGVDRLMFLHNILDPCPFGRQQDWEDSPSGWPQHPTYG